jgi:hypothetical protein
LLDPNVQQRLRETIPSKLVNTPHNIPLSGVRAHIALEDDIL